MRTKVACLVAMALGFGVAQTASAADMPVKAPKASPVSAPDLSWTGCYVGGHAGYSWSRWQDNSLSGAVAGPANPIASPGDPIVFGYSGDYRTGGFAGGFQGGCDRQYGAFVVGAVLDFTWTDQKKDSDPFQIQPV